MEVPSARQAFSVGGKADDRGCTVGFTHQHASLRDAFANLRTNEKSTYLVRFLMRSSRWGQPGSNKVILIFLVGPAATICIGVLHVESIVWQDIDLSETNKNTNKWWLLKN
ncbi:hypothetical protein [Bradyrhizobium sp. JR3.5]